VLVIPISVTPHALMAQLVRMAPMQILHY